MPAANIRRPRKIAPGEKMNVACIGIAGKGSSDALAMKNENVVAVCDVNMGNKRVQKVLKAYPKAKCYSDYRKMLAEMDSQIDAVTVSTPDHTHFPGEIRIINDLEGERKRMILMTSEYHFKRKLIFLHD